MTSFLIQNRLRQLAVGAAVAALACSGPASRADALRYPFAATASRFDRYGATQVEDPYQWLEDNIQTAPRVRNWVEAENRLTRRYLARVPERRAILRRLEALHNIETVSPPVRLDSGKFFFRRRPGDQQAALWVVRSNSSKPVKLIDPASWSKDGTSALADVAYELKGRLVAYAVHDAGSDWRTWRVIDTATGKVFPDEVRWNKFGAAAWDYAGQGFYYTRFSKPPKDEEFRAQNAGEQLYYHRLGEPQAKDRLVYENKANPDHMFIGSVSADGRYLIVNSGFEGGGATLLVEDLTRPEDGFKPISIGKQDQLASNRFVAVQGAVFYVLTNEGAPNRRLVAFDLGHLGNPPRIIIPETTDPLLAVTCGGERFFAHYLHHGKSRIRVFREDGAQDGEVSLPGPGLARGFAGPEDASTVYFDYTSFTTPFSVYRYDIATRRVAPVLRPRGPVNPAHYVVEEAFYTSRDGKRVPMFLAYRKGGLVKGATPTLLYGYGGFGLTFPPDFRPEQVTWMDMGGLFAFPQLPGDGTYGEEWHRAGMLQNKPAVFDAFVDAAEYLVGAGYTNPRKLAALGYSNGGLLIGATTTKRPDLFAVAFPTVGILDLLRFPQFNNGRLWAREYGDPEDSKMFPILRSYSPYHNIQPGRRYPAILIGTAETDDRVAPMHSLKFAARLQALAASDKPVLLQVEMKAGHGAGTKQSSVANEAADRLAFSLKNLDMRLPPGFGRP
ncbi:prolyl oligopeptidase family protein [Bradyrhizobium sp. CCGUVB14]|uniref:prolyl oligopeptidase family serine peptidase n=1 Tax=Bradyrhizobium sp. CCGUVB14 TaxID=2949628 RepID=UPI0020B33C0E|nr:prolyl oligopeptidase family serine peptidase [Bradyrhizobium sp. CCGUVB14]MCP3441293.1 prolyl oligopeptidase family serine peptidase [Bradyrhizobium sp. CCGUVB14]